MANDEEDEKGKRHRRTVYLLTAGAISLLLPLAGVAYLRVTYNTPPPETTGSGAAIFDRRGGADSKSYIKAAPTPAVVPPTRARARAAPATSKAAAAATPSSSLGMVKGGDDYYQEPKPQSPPAPLVPAPAPPAAAPPIAREKKKPAPKKERKKPITYPKLQTSGSSFAPGKFGNKLGQKGGSQNDQTETPGGAPDMAAMIKNLPKGAGIPNMDAMIQQMQQQQQQQSGQK